MKKIPTALRFLQFRLRFQESISPVWAGKSALPYFLTPFRFNRPKREDPSFYSAKQTEIEVAEKKVVVFEWGEGPSVWLVHGWAGRATQFYKIKDALVEIGYHVIGFDAPAHGISSGKQTSIVEFGETLRKIHAIYGDPKAYIGHSFGGIVGFYAHFSGIEIGRFVSIGAPVKSKEIMIEFLQRLSLTKRSYPGFNTAFKKRFGFELDAYSIQTWIKTSKPKHGLIIHDVEDLDAPIHHSYALREMLPDYEYYYTRGLGHNRILGDPVVIEKVIHYIQKEEIPIEQIKNPGKS